MGKEQRQLHTCPTCSGARVITTWKRAQLDNHPEVQEILTTEDCPICDGSGQILGLPT
jgi:DnaJ-class molecular chaperone